MNRDEHRALRELLGAHALGQLDPLERAGVEAHLAGCAECRAELASIAPLAGALATVDVRRLETVPAPPPGLGDKIVRRVRAERPSRLARSSRWLVPVAAAAVIAAAAGGVGYRLAPDPPRPPLEAVAVQAADPAIDATASLIPHTWGVEIRLTASGFDQGVPYYVSILDTEGTARSAGEFVGTGASRMVCNLNSSLLRGQAAGFRVADADGTVLVTSSF